MSALSKQLAAIASKSTHELDVKAQRTAFSKSLLFEPKQAASQTYDSLYHVGVQGLEELIRLDAKFEPFRHTIFSPQSIGQDRTLMNQEDAQKLDRVLEGFLGRVGSKLLLKPALKAIEWLVRRFRIHETNTDFMILTFLPYHAAPIFPTFLSILPNELSPAFRFLHPYQASLTNVPRTVLVQTATQHQNFLTALNVYVIDRASLQQQYSGLVQLWASVVVQAIEARLSSSQSGRREVQSQRQQDVLVQLLPTLSRALALNKAPEMTLGTYMVVLVLSSKVDLADATLDGFIQAICRNWSLETIDAAMGCIAALVERKASARLPTRALQSFLSIEDLHQKLSLLSEHQSVSKLATAVVAGTIANNSRDDNRSSQFEGLQFVKDAAASTYLTASAKQRLVQQVDSLSTENTPIKLQLESLRASLTQAPEGPTEALYLEDAGNDSEDITMGDDDEEDPSAKASAVASVLDDMKSEKIAKSFLAETANHAYRKLSSVFPLCIGHEERTTQLLGSKVFGKDSAWKHCSFLLRIASSHNSAAARRYAASQFLIKFKEAQKTSPQDCQAVLPWVLVLLSDHSAKVRRVAVKIVAAIRKVSGKADSNSRWGSGLLYDTEDGSRSAALWLPTKVVIDFIEKTITPSLEECTIDSDQIGRILVSALDDSASHSADSSKKRLKSAQREEVFAWLAAHVASAGTLHLKVRLLPLLNKVSKSGKKYRSQFLLPTLVDWAVTTPEAATKAADFGISLQKISDEFLRIVHAHDVDALLSIQTLALEDTSSRPDVQQAIFSRIATFWPSIREEPQKTLANFMLDAIASPQNESTKGLASAAFNEAAFSEDILANLLEEVNTALGRKEPASKRRKTDDASLPEQSPETKAYIAKLTLILERAESAQPLTSLKLFYTLFNTLQVLQEIRAQQQMNLTFVVDLALSNLSGMVPGVEAATEHQQLDASIVRTDLLVDCVRTSNNAQSRNSAMLLLSSLAKKVPQQVLHTVMPIFTLMSSSSLSQNDDFTIHVVDQTIQEVVPLMVESLHQQKRDIVYAVAEILLSFASAFEHIPPSRRQHLFTILASSLGPDEALFAVLATLKDHAPGNLDLARFSSQLMQQFSATTCMTTVVEYLKLCLDYYSPKKRLYQMLIRSDTASTDPAEGLGRLLSLLASILKDSTLQNKVRAEAEDEEVSSHIVDSYKQVLQSIIQLSRLAEDETRIKGVCPKVLEGLLSLLQFPDFVTAAKDLLGDDVDANLRRSVVRALELQVRTGSHQTQQSRQAALACIPTLTNILDKSDNAPLKHSTIACLNRISEKFGKLDLGSTLQAAQAVSSTSCLSSDDNLLRTLSLHCLTSTVEVLRNDFIPLLQSSIQSAADCIQRSLLTKDVRLLSAAYAVVIAITEHTPFVVSAKSVAPIFLLSQQIASKGLGREADESRQHFFEMAATKLDLAVVCEVATLVWQSAVDSGVDALRDLIKFVGLAIDNRGKSVVGRNVRHIFKFFLSAMDLRWQIASSPSNAEYEGVQVDEVEVHLINSLLATVFKINDTVFRPFFNQLMDWSAAEGAEAVVSTQRSITLFNFLFSLSERLKSLVTTYFVYVVERSAEVLNEAVKKNATKLQLQSSVLKALKSSFANDQDEFWQSPSRFSAMLGPVMSQLSSCNLQRATSEVIPAVTELASCANSQDNLKEMNSLLLKQFRSGNAVTRLAAVRCQQSLTDSLGEDWLSLLPEMLPLISELQEDDDERVERETHKWIKAIEKLLGESLDTMLQ